MQFEDVMEVAQVVGAGNANKRLKEGWKLLAVVPATVNNGTSSSALYVLGKSTADENGENKDPPIGKWVG